MNVIRELHELNGRFLAIYGDIYEEHEHLPPKQMDLMQDKLISEYKEELEILLMRACIDRAREKYRLQLEIAAYTPRTWRFLWIFKRKYNAAAKKIMAEVDAEVERLLRENIHLGPLHMPANIAGIDACIKALPGVPNVAVFDTAFHTTMPDKASMYAIPYEDYEQFKIKKYGFHGTSHKYVSGCAIDYLKSKGLPWDKIVTCHLGNGSSITAVKDGKSVDTSMGMTPLEGVPMGTRSGDIDASVVEMLCSWKGMTPQQVVTYLNKQSGFQGVSGVSSDSRNVLEAAEKGNYRAQLAMDMFTYRVKKYIGSYAAAMGGLDCIVMTGGIGENSGPLRKGILEGLEFLGVELDEEVNAKVRQPKCIHEINTADSRVKILVIPTNEELVIARETRDVVTAAKR